MKSTTITFLLLFFSLFSVVNAQDYARLTNLPHIIIKTFDGRMVSSKTTYVYATMYYVDENDNVTRYDSLQIRGRGNSTWSLSKKPYRLKFHNKEKFLGKGYANAKSWTLLANAGDKTLIRNCITYAMGDFLGLKNTPACKFVDLTMNNTYLGNYQISDQVEVRPHRVNIIEQDYPLTDDSNITGGYLLEVDGFKDGNCFTTNRYQVSIRVHYPDEEEIAYSQNAYIKDYISQFEAALQSSDFADKEKGYRQYVDSVSLANWFVATEVSGNIDGYFSTYFYKEQDDPKLYWGPLWDYDIAYANDNRKGDTSRQLMTDNGYGDAKNWINRMWDDPWFGRLVNRRYIEVLDEGIEDFLYNTIDSVTQHIASSRELNYEKWGISTRMLRERVLYSSYDKYVRDLKNYISAHISYLATAFEEKKPAEPTPPFVADDSYYYRIVNANCGNSLTTDGNEACTWNFIEQEYGQQWEILPVGDYFMIINRQSGLALNDPTPGYATATSNVGTRLNVSEQNADDDSQLWYFVPQGTVGYYNVVNKRTEHTMNLSGGSSNNGATVLSYTTDSRNSSSMNRLWYVRKDENRVVYNGIASVEPEDYALAYNEVSKELHFGCDNTELLTFYVSIYSMNGSLIKEFKASERCSVADIPSGIYVIRWSVGGKTCGVKVKL